MAVANKIGNRYIAKYGGIAASLPGQNLDWLRGYRDAAFASFSATGLPSPREEEWKYTNVAPIERQRFSPASADFEWLDERLLEQTLINNAYNLVIVNGHFSAKHSRLDGLPEKAIVGGMADALRQYPDLVKDHWGSAADHESHGFVAFNTAFFSDGAFIYLPTNLEIDKPIQIVYLASQPEIMSTARNLIVVGIGAEAKIIETFAGSDELAYQTASVTEVCIGDNAGIELFKLQSESRKAFHFGGTYVQQNRGARFKHHNFSFGGLLARNDIHANLGVASECELNGLFLASERQHSDQHTRIDHRQPHGISREVYKGVVDQKARGVFQGRVVVHEDAQKTDSEMSNRNLTLSPDAEVDTKPQLEIYADDVKCAHGVTVGQLEDESVFYLKSRGVDQETARNMLTFAFTNEMLEKIQLKSLRVKILEQLLVLFPQQGIRKEWL